MVLILNVFPPPLQMPSYQGFEIQHVIPEMIKLSPRHTGNTTGMPPLTAFDPSSAAFSLNHRFSLPLLFFQLITVAPCSRISTLSPVGSLAVIRVLSGEMSTVGCGAEEEPMGEMAEGLLGRSTIVRSR